MKTLIVDDEFVGRLLIQELLKKYGPCHIAVNGREALEAVHMALDEDEPYDLICLDIMMPEMDGQEALKEIRALEASRGIHFPRWAKIVMTTALTDSASVLSAMREQCDGFLVKPIRKEKLFEALRKMGLID